MVNIQKDLEKPWFSVRKMVYNWWVSHIHIRLQESTPKILLPNIAKWIDDETMCVFCLDLGPKIYYIMKEHKIAAMIQNLNPFL